MKRPTKQFFYIFLAIISVWLLVEAFFWYSQYRGVQKEVKRQAEAIESVLFDRQQEQFGGDADPFGEDNIARVLLIGLDSRAGEEHGHCDAIQMIEIDKEKESISITAVPRGTYSPLPFGKGTTSSEYYVSNSCALGGLEYGIKNIERIVKQEADYLVVVGFSEALGILRKFELPTTETLQWLRNRQGYAIGEPQRARNHSTFLKNMLVRFTPEDVSAFDKTFHYIVYKMVQTDLTFSQTEVIIEVLSGMKLNDQPEKIQLFMKPAYDVQDIPYNPEEIGDHLSATVGRISGWLSKDDYAGLTAEEIQDNLLHTIDEKIDDDEFLMWAFENDLWLQVENDAARDQVRWDFMMRYMEIVPEEKKEVLADYILEMEHLGETEWGKKGKGALLEELEKERTDT
jgi:anionic cell wall polymer biosynthesis LytR-Cps2A-Psr (LCP) family protein